MPPTPKASPSPGRLFLWAALCPTAIYLLYRGAAAAGPWLPAMAWFGLAWLGWATAVGLAVGALLHAGDRAYENKELRKRIDETASATAAIWTHLRESDCRGAKAGADHEVLMRLRDAIDRIDDVDDRAKALEIGLYELCNRRSVVVAPARN
jgi:hypothetical protein